MKRALLVALFVISAPSCGEPSIEPVTGTWDFVEGATIENSCGSEIDISSGLFTLTNNGDGTFTVTPEDGEEPFDCDLDGETFDCPERLATTVMQPGVDATIEVRTHESGTFSSSTAASGRRDGTASCTGAQCSLAEAALGITFPCSAAIGFTASFQN